MQGPLQGGPDCCKSRQFLAASTRHSASARRTPEKGDIFGLFTVRMQQMRFRYPGIVHRIPQRSYADALWRAQKAFIRRKLERFQLLDFTVTLP